jgi:uncharacterized membrane protein
MNYRIVMWVYLALLLLQVGWHFLLPQPWGNRNWILALVASLPLLLPLRGIARGRMRSMTWAGFLAVLYFVIGVMEAWSNPPQRLPALLQVVLALGYCALFAWHARTTGKSASVNTGSEPPGSQS